MFIAQFIADWPQIIEGSELHFSLLPAVDELETLFIAVGERMFKGLSTWYGRNL